MATHTQHQHDCIHDARRRSSDGSSSKPRLKRRLPEEGAALFHTGLSPAVGPGTPLNGARHSAGAPPGFNWSGEERETGGASEHKGGSQEAGEQGLGRTCAEDTNAAPPPASPRQSPGLEIPGVRVQV